MVYGQKAKPSRWGYVFKNTYLCVEKALTWNYFFLLHLKKTLIVCSSKQEKLDLFSLFGCEHVVEVVCHTSHKARNVKWPRPWACRKAICSTFVTEFPNWAATFTLMCWSDSVATRCLLVLTAAESSRRCLPHPGLLISAVFASCHLHKSFIPISCFTTGTTSHFDS